jgi:hypothetical protein
MDDLMKTVVEQVVDSVSTQTENVVIETVTDELVSTVSTANSDDLALDTLDLLLDTGAAEGLAALFGAPVIIVLGIKALKSYRKRSRANATS